MAELWRWTDGVTKARKHRVSAEISGAQLPGITSRECRYISYITNPGIYRWVLQLYALYLLPILIKAFQYVKHFQKEVAN